jgi:hypothetical protein
VQGIRVRVISVRLGGDRTVEFYDLGGAGVLVMESGRVADPVLLRKTAGVGELLHEGRFADVFASLRPDLPVPAPLRAPVSALGAWSRSGDGGRLVVTARSHATGVEPATDEKSGDGETWLFDNVRLASDSWFYQDHGWSWHNALGTSYWTLIACTSGSACPLTLDVWTKDGERLRSWPIAPGRYRTCWWDGGRLAQMDVSALDERATEDRACPATPQITRSGSQLLVATERYDV